MPKKVPVSLLLVLFFIALTPTFLLISKELYSPKDLRQVTIAVSMSPLTAPFFIAQHQGYFERCGLDVALVPTAGGLKAFEAMLRGEVDFATSSDSVVTFAATQANAFKVVASFASSDNDVKIVAAAGKSFTNGKIQRIGYYPGTASEYLLKTYLALHSIDIASFDFIAVDAPALVDQFIAQQLDAIVIWEPYAKQAERARVMGGDVIDSRNLHSLHFDLIAGDQVMQSKETEALQLLSALQKAILFIHENPQESQEIVAKALNTETQIIDFIWPDYQFKISFAAAHTYSYLANIRWLDLTEHSLAIDPRAFIYQANQSQPIPTTFRRWCGAT